MQKITIVLDKNGGVKVETIGFKGDDCLKKTEFIKKIFIEKKVKYKLSFYEEKEEITILNTDGLPSNWCG